LHDGGEKQHRDHCRRLVRLLRGMQISSDSYRMQDNDFNVS
jgi:hypothetical protein